MAVYSRDKPVKPYWEFSFRVHDKDLQKRISVYLARNDVTFDKTYTETERVYETLYDY